jgi:hypothetical protein
MPDGPARAALYEAIGRSVLAMTADLPGMPSSTGFPSSFRAIGCTCFIECFQNLLAKIFSHD